MSKFDSRRLSPNQEARTHFVRCYFRSPKNRATSRAVSFIHCLKLNRSPGIS